MESPDLYDEDSESPEPSSPPPDIIPPGSCIHLVYYKTEDVLNNYELLHSYYVACLHKDSWKRKAKECKCNTCGTNETVHACLSCINFSCYEHVRDHARAKFHPLAMDTDFGRVFCTGCENYRYDPELENVSQKQKLLAFQERGPVTGVTYKWEPTSDEADLLKFHPIMYISETDTRGFSNLKGLTCYLITLVQSLIHAPVFRDYLLSFKHECKFKMRKSEDKTPVCFICEMANIVQECFSGESEPVFFSDLLYLYWVRCKQRTNLKFEDAFECFVDLLDNFHQDEEPLSAPELPSVSDPSCNCIIHNIFECRFEKYLICNNCNNMSIKPGEPSSWAIELGTFFNSSLPGNSDQSSMLLTDSLKNCLEEVICDYRCSNCSEKGCTLKSIPLQLPIILSFCLIKTLDKFDFIFEFQEFLDMSPYKLKNDNEDLPSSNLKYQYYLFAVIEYILIDSKGKRIKRTKNRSSESSIGHYICYLRQCRQKWIKCNDEKITPITLEEVLKINARMLFYHRMYI